MKQGKQYTCALEEDREMPEFPALVGLCAQQLQTPQCSHLEEQNRKALRLLEIGGISTGTRWSPLLLGRESGCNTYLFDRCICSAGWVRTLRFCLALWFRADVGLSSDVWSKLLSV